MLFIGSENETLALLGDRASCFNLLFTMTPIEHFVGSEATIVAEERHDDDLFEVGNIGNAHAAFAHSSARMARTLHHHPLSTERSCCKGVIVFFRSCSGAFAITSSNAGVNPPLNHNDVLLTASVVSEHAAARVFLPFNALSFIATFGRYGFSTNEFPEGSSTMNVKGSSSPAESLSMCWQKASTCSYTSGHVSLRYGCSWRSCSETRLRIPSTVLRSPCCVIGGMSSCNSGMLMVQLSPLMI